MRLPLRALPFALGLVLAPLAVRAAETPIPPPPTRWVTDHAAFLSPAAAAALDDRLAAYDSSSGHQVLVYIDRTTGGVPIEDWAVRAFERWRVGRKGIDDGVVLFLFSEDHHVRIEVGYGLEERVPDAVASRIIAERIVPRIRAGDRDGAVTAGVDGILAAVGGESGDAARGAAKRALQPTVEKWKLVAGGVVMLILLLFALTHPGLAWLLLMNVGSGRGRGGGWGGGGWGGGGGGGFSGGGGRSGGGGASGSW